jgi:pimeloyl-ACP methyl ester carboxylesterase
VIGHSWGTVLALAVAKREPGLVDQLIMTGVLADYLQNGVVQSNFVRSRRGDAASREAGTPPFIAREQVVAMGKHLRELGGVFGELSFARIGELSAKTHIYADKDWESQGAGADFAIGALMPQIAAYRAIDSTPALDVPVTFIQGERDMATPTTLARLYFDALRAPRGKQWVEVPHAAHFVMWEHPQEFADIVAAALTKLQ